MQRRRAGFHVNLVDYSYGIPACQDPNQLYATEGNESLFSMADERGLPPCIMKVLNPNVPLYDIMPVGRTVCVPGIFLYCDAAANMGKV